MQKNNFRSAIAIVCGLIGLCIIVFASMYILSLMNIDWRDNYFFLVFSFPLFIFSAIFLLMLYSLRSTYKQELNTIQHRTYLIHWVYSEDEWSQFNVREWKKTRKRAITIPLGCLAFFLVVLFGDKELSEIASSVAPRAIGCTLAFIVLMFFYTYTLYKRTTTCPREVIIGPHGVLYGEYYSTWSAPGTSLGKVKVLPGKQVVLEIEIKMWGRYGSSQKLMRIPDPMGREKEAEELVAKLTTP